MAPRAWSRQTGSNRRRVSTPFAFGLGLSLAWAGAAAADRASAGNEQSSRLADSRTASGSGSGAPEAATAPEPRSGTAPPSPKRVFTAPGPAAPPSAPAAPLADAQREEELLAAITLNARAMSPGVPLLRRSGEIYARATDLEAWRIRWPATAPTLRHEGATFVALSAIPGLAARFDAQRQQLDITIAPSGLRAVEIDYHRARPPVATPPATPGAFLGYGLSAYRSAGVDAYSGLLGAGAFGPFGVVTTDVLATGGGAARSRAVRLDTTLRYDMPQRMQTLIVGDTLLSPIGPWGRAYRMGGIQFGTNFGVQPGFATGPLQSISGTAAVPSVVDILVNGQRIGQRNVPAGNFTINDVPYVTGAGNIQAVVRDPLGREQVYTQSYYLSSRLLAKGLDQWAVEAGALRYGYGEDSADYRDFIAGAAWRRGLTNALTGEIRARATRDARLVGGGIDASLFGNVNASLSAGWSAADSGHGAIVSVGIQRTGQRGPSFALQYAGAQRGFREPGDPEDRLGFRELVSGTVGLPLGRYGSVAAGYSRSAFWGDRPGYSVGTLSYFLNLPGRSFLALNVAHGISGTTGTSATLNLTIPFGDGNTYAGAGVGWNSESTRAGGRAWQAQASVSRTPPIGDGYGYRVAATDRGDFQAVGTFQNRYAQLQGEAGRWFGRGFGRMTLSGGGVLVGDRAGLARDVAQSFALVDASGLANVPVYLNGSLYGRTGADGTLVVTRLPAYMHNEISVRPSDFSLSYALAETSKAITPYYHSGSLVHFDIRPVREATAQLIGANGKPLPAGTPVRVNGADEAYVGLAGEVFLKYLRERNTLVAQDNGGRCSFEFEFPAGAAEPVPDLGALRCGR
ncbi:MAG TPA: fimbria/pilus outer membrane usher protein [Burkholderiaceae bacterium]